jgi:hypothetical protein
MKDPSCASVDWDRLTGAYGSAEEVGELLALIESGEDVWGDLFSHVLHQGSLFEATIPAIDWVILALEQNRLVGHSAPIGRSADANKGLSQRAWAFVFLSAAAGSATQFPQPGSVAADVLSALRQGTTLYRKGLADAETQVRVASAAILKLVAVDRARALTAINRQYKIEVDSEARVTLLSAMNALAKDAGRWSDRLMSILDSAASNREKFYAAGYLTRRLGKLTPASVGIQMAELFAGLPEAVYLVELTNVEEPDKLFWESVRKMERSTAVAGLAMALELCGGKNGSGSPDRVLTLTEWLLRLVSKDERSGWGCTASSRGPKIEYFGIEPSSETGDWLRSSEASLAIRAIVKNDGVWRIQTNLLSLFGLPARRQELRDLLVRIQTTSPL